MVIRIVISPEGKLLCGEIYWTLSRPSCSRESVREEVVMTKKKESYRDNLKQIMEVFPRRKILYQKGIAQWLQMNNRTIKVNFPRKGGRIRGPNCWNQRGTVWPGPYRRHKKRTPRGGNLKAFGSGTCVREQQQSYDSMF